MNTNEQITLPDGSVVGTGLLVPDVKATSFPLFAEKVPILTDEQIRDVIHDSMRMKMRDRFPQDVWGRNQGNRGSCNGYAGARGLSRARALRGLDPVHLSGEYLYAAINGGRDEGSMLDDAFDWIQKNGIAPESLVPYQEYRWNNVSAEARASAANYKGLELYAVDSREELYSAVALGFVCVIAVHVGRSFTAVDNLGRVPRSHGVGNHAVMVTDIYEIGGKLWLEFDFDWGPNVGQQGLGFVNWENHLQQTNQNHFFYAIRSTTDGPG